MRTRRWLTSCMRFSALGPCESVRNTETQRRPDEYFAHCRSALATPEAMCPVIIHATSIKTSESEVLVCESGWAFVSDVPMYLYRQPAGRFRATCFSKQSYGVLTSHPAQLEVSGLLTSLCPLFFACACVCVQQRVGIWLTSCSSGSLAQEAQRHLASYLPIISRTVCVFMLF